MSGTTPNFNLYIPADNETDWSVSKVNKNFTDIDTLLAARMVTPGGTAAIGDMIAWSGSAWVRIVPAANKVLIGVNGAVPSFATLLSSIMTVDANMAMANHKLTGLAAGSDAADSVRYDQLTAGISAVENWVSQNYVSQYKATASSNAKKTLTGPWSSDLTVHWVPLASITIPPWIAGGSSVRVSGTLHGNGSVVSAFAVFCGANRVYYTETSLSADSPFSVDVSGVIGGDVISVQVYSLSGGTATVNNLIVSCDITKLETVDMTW